MCNSERACARGSLHKEHDISALEASVGGKFKNDHAHANTRDAIKMADIAAGFSASGSSAPPLSGAPSIAAPQLESLARNAAEFREPPPPPSASDQAGVINAPSSAARVGGVGNGLGDAPEVSEQGARKRRVVVCKKCGAEGHMEKTCGRAGADSASGAQPAPRRAREGGGAAPPGNGQGQPYDDDEGEDALAEDADDVYIEIGCYKFQAGDFTWEQIDVPHAVAEEVQRDLRSGHHAYAARDLPKFKLGPARCKHIKARTTKAWDFLELLLDETLIGMLVDNTNKYARCSAYKDTRRGKEWRDVDVAEMKLYLAIVFYMGVVRVPSRQHVFDPAGLFAQEWVFSRMSKTRFDAISRCMHSDAPWDLSPQERERKNKADPFWQTDKFCERLCENFMHYWMLGQCADLDECSCGFRGKHKCRCFNPAKPHKYHFKMFSWNCSETGYCFCFYWYRGKEEQRPPDVPATLWPITKLTTKVINSQRRIQRNNFVLTTDNWYTSLHEGIFLARHGIHCCGTLRANRVTAA